MKNSIYTLRNPTPDLPVANDTLADALKRTNLARSVMVTCTDNISQFRDRSIMDQDQF